MPLAAHGELAFERSKAQDRKAAVADEPHAGNFELGKFDRQLAVEVLEEQRHDGGAARAAAEVGRSRGTVAVVFGDSLRQARGDHRACLRAVASGGDRVVALDELRNRLPIGRARGVPVVQCAVVVGVVVGRADVVVFVAVDLQVAWSGGARRGGVRG